MVTVDGTTLKTPTEQALLDGVTARIQHYETLAAEYSSAKVPIVGR